MLRLFPLLFLAFFVLPGPAVAQSLQEQMEMIRQQELMRRQKIQQNYEDTTPASKPVVHKPAPKPVAKPAPEARPVADVAETAAPSPSPAAIPPGVSPELFPYGACNEAGAKAARAVRYPKETEIDRKIQASHMVEANNRAARRLRSAEADLTTKYGDLTGQGVLSLQQMVAAERAKQGECLFRTDLDNIQRAWWAQAESVTKANDAERAAKAEAIAAERATKAEAAREAQRPELDVFGVVLTRATKQQLRKAIEAKNGVWKQYDAHRNADFFDASRVLEGLGQMGVFYTNDGRIAYVVYFEAPFEVIGNSIGPIFVEKYGAGESSGGFKKWYCRDGATLTYRSPASVKADNWIEQLAEPKLDIVYQTAAAQDQAREFSERENAKKRQHTEKVKNQSGF